MPVRGALHRFRPPLDRAERLIRADLLQILFSVRSERRHGAERLSRPRTGAIPFHDDDGRLHSCPDVPVADGMKPKNATGQA